jgi:uncharacterized protein (DUF1697 family)
MTEYIGLLRGINVGRAKRIPMAELRSMLEELGYSNVRTLLNSGNAVFWSEMANKKEIASQIEAGIVARFGFSVKVVVLDSADLQEIIEDAALLPIANDPSRHMIAFVLDSSKLTKARPLLETQWDPDVLALGRRAAYLWCANGILESKLILAFGKAMGEDTTTRNWATVLKLEAIVK